MNKYQEALAYLRNSVVATDHKQKEKANQYISVLQELVDKATPKKPINCGNMMYIPVCPHYGHILDSKADNHCSKCNQRLDWGDEYD